MVVDGEPTAAVVVVNKAESKLLSDDDFWQQPVRRAIGGRSERRGKRYIASRRMWT